MLHLRIVVPNSSQPIHHPFIENCKESKAHLLAVNYCHSKNQIINTTGPACLPQLVHTPFPSSPSLITLFPLHIIKKKKSR